MRLLLDTHILMWLALDPARLPHALCNELDAPSTEVVFSAVNIWEIAIKRALNRPDFTVEPHVILSWARASNLTEILVTSEQSMAVSGLPRLHGDPFDRLLMAQATVEGLMLITSDKTVARYPGPIRLV